MLLLLLLLGSALLLSGRECGQGERRAPPVSQQTRGLGFL